MTRRCLKCFWLCAILLWLAPFVQAEVIYLKNGTVMKGRIVGRDEQTIILQTGEDPQARSTIFLSDINKMMSDEEFENQSLSSSLAVLQPQTTWVPPSFENGPVLPNSSGENSVSHIQELVQSQQEFLAKQAQEQEQAERDPTKLAIEIERKRTRAEQTRIDRLRSKPREGNGSISGTITLPDLSGMSADLYVYLLEDAGDGHFVAPDRMLFQKIAAGEITSTQIPYRITNVPAGAYKVLAQWDLSKPDVSINNSGGNVSLDFLGTRGDYSGYTRKTVTLGIDEIKDKVDFSCTTFIDEDKVHFDWGAKPLFRVKDIYYLKSYPDEDKFYLVVENLSSKPIETLPLDIYINDKKVFAFSWQFKEIPARSQKEFDITTAFKGYQKIMRGQGGNALKFRVNFAGSRDAEFEKVVYVFL